jgi:hypothetical protein
MPTFFLGNYLFRMYEIHVQYNWMFPLHMLFFHIISIYYASTKQGLACLSCTSSFPVHATMSSLHESHFSTSWDLNSEPSAQRCFYRLHNFNTQHTTVCECFPHSLSPPLRIQLQLVVCNVCQTRTPFSQTTTAALSVGRPCTWAHVRNKHQCSYQLIFTLLSLFWNEKKKVGHYFLSNLHIKSGEKRNGIKEQQWKPEKCKVILQQP